MNKGKGSKIYGLTIDQVKNKIISEIKKHMGEYAILLEKNGRHSFSFFIQITGLEIAQYMCYDYEGNFRCTLTKHLDPVLLFIGEQQLIWLDCV